MKNFFKKVPILRNGERGEKAAPEEEEAHAEVEHGVEMFPCDDFIKQNDVDR